ncbi:myosin-1-like [Phalaenopsis equestris]|uniref:myosin-1-like n=1 Tax=Phalaenopsis equestris TaxID=78828 RepID=UPI0009E1A40E|nr:myosin-1-like [Phalaenopsis equestris]
MPNPGTSTSRKKTTPEKHSTIPPRKPTQQRRPSAISKKKTTPDKQHAPQKKKTPPEKSNAKPRSPSAALCSVQSPPESRFADVSPPAETKKAENVASAAEGEGDIDDDDGVEINKLGGVIEAVGANLCSSAEEDLDGFRVDDDSPYRSNSAAAEERICKMKENVTGEGSVCLPEKFSPLNERRWSDTSCHDAKKKLQVWCQLPNGEWVLGNIISISGAESLLSLPEGKVLKFEIKALLPANPEILDGVEDLMQLSYLNEPSVLYNLQYRYDRNMIYSKAGPVLVAINPFKEVQLYGNEYIEAYRRKSTSNPHVYAIADTAIHEMIRDEVNQSIIISGESGAGKTETAKIAMQYLAALGGGGSGMEYEILQTNPILEAFGNARTAKNDNSSRGKLIEIQFNSIGKIYGANIQTFLLEKSRVVQCAPGERSYHIFYQLCAGASKSLREKLNLKSAEEYKYLRRTNCFTISGVNDAERFRSVQDAMKVVHISEEQQEEAYTMLATVLWLGNISFSVIDNENHVEVVADEAAITVSKLLGCEILDLKLALSTREMRVGNDHIVQKLTLSQAIDSRDALAKSLYASLFDWIVENVNKAIGVGKLRTGRSISILDIYGFESFDRNSFEQFCINYANERLQQHFNRHLFKLEQEEYIQEGIDWAKVDFKDNRDCLNLFEKKPLGLLSLLDEETTFPNATDLTFADKLRKHLHPNPCFKGERGKAFSVSHYAGEVAYDSTGFLEKNRDLLHLDSIQLLASCTCNLPKIFASKALARLDLQGDSPFRLSGVDSPKLSVTKKFKGQLFQLMHKLESTTPHFIRCIKPNISQLPALYEQDLVLHQLKCCGVLEVVRISKSGYPTKMSHTKFARRYGFLLLENVASQDPLSVSVAILHQFNILPEMYQVGYTKLFFRTGQIGAIEDTRNRTLHGILRVQSCFRGHQARVHVQDCKKGIVMLQSFIRGKTIRQAYSAKLWKHRAAIVLQKHIKGRLCRKKYLRMTEASITMQSVIRGWFVRRCSRDVGFQKQFDGEKVAESDQVMIEASVLPELQRKILKIETALREKEEENEKLHQRLLQYERRQTYHDEKMKSLEEEWQKQISSLQSSLSVASETITADNHDDRSSGASSVDQCLDNSCNQNGSRFASQETEINAIGRLTGEIGQRTVEVKSGKEEADLDPEKELKRLKQTFEAWKKDFSAELRETQAVINKMASEDSNSEKTKKKWWVRLSAAKISSMNHS